MPEPGSFKIPQSEWEKIAHDGRFLRQTAAEYGVSISVIYKIRKRVLGAAYRKKEYNYIPKSEWKKIAHDKRTIKVIAAEYGVNTTSIFNIRKKVLVVNYHRYRICGVRQNWLEIATDDGANSEIAAKWGITEENVRTIRKKILGEEGVVSRRKRAEKATIRRYKDGKLQVR